MEIESAMLQAIALSEKALGKTAPNPIVGAVIIDVAGNIVGQGAHDRMHSPDHAEVIALNQAKNKARGAMLVVTLEPCNHTGATPPCTQRIIDAGISSVIFALKDPNPQAGGGEEVLRKAGINVQYGICEEEAAYSNRAWLMKIEKGRPYFTWKVAATLDGKVAAPDGTSKWITSAASRADVQFLRRAADAILVGTNTVIMDDPHLVPRGDFVGYTANPLRIICGEQDLPPNAKIFDNTARSIVVKTKDLNQLVEILNQASVNHVLVEAGPTLAGAMLKAGLMDELVIYQAPSIIGAGRAFVAEFGAITIDDRLVMDHIETQILDGDIKSKYRIRNGTSCLQG